MMYLIQILIPTYDNNGTYFNKDLYNVIREELIELFGGVTIYTQAPAIGIWKKKNKNVRDEIIIFEIMTEKINRTYWNDYRVKLENMFRQNAIIIRASTIELL